MSVHASIVGALSIIVWFLVPRESLKAILSILGNRAFRNGGSVKLLINGQDCLPEIIYDLKREKKMSWDTLAQKSGLHRDNIRRFCYRSHNTHQFFSPLAFCRLFTALEVTPVEVINRATRRGTKMERGDDGE